MSTHISPFDVGLRFHRVSVRITPPFVRAVGPRGEGHHLTVASRIRGVNTSRGFARAGLGSGPAGGGSGQPAPRGTVGIPWRRQEFPDRGRRCPVHALRSVRSAMPCMWLRLPWLAPAPRPDQPLSCCGRAWIPGPRRRANTVSNAVYTASGYGGGRRDKVGSTLREQGRNAHSGEIDVWHRGETEPHEGEVFGQ